MKDYSLEATKYTECMEEVKRRTNAIMMMLKKERSTGYIYTDAEFICLQFRKILELIALANLVSNQEEYTKKHQNFANHYNASHILRDIEKINPNYYPRPTKQIIDEKTGKVIEVVDIPNGFLTKDEFISVYNECSELLHAENPFSNKKDITGIYKKFENWYNKIQTLLTYHHVQLLDSKMQFWVIMHAKDSGRVHVNLFQLMEKEGSV